MGVLSLDDTTTLIPPPQPRIPTMHHRPSDLVRRERLEFLFSLPWGNREDGHLQIRERTSPRTRPAGALFLDVSGFQKCETQTRMSIV